MASRSWERDTGRGDTDRRTCDCKCKVTIKQNEGIDDLPVKDSYANSFAKDWLEIWKEA
ncbi:hypothetical protein [Oceanobacillus salinisoli]|uniref:hypothetical protein n=1 Tax=Oceanobacillus salinisoli TaxID=2678611 RepID=UPI0012E0CAA1|nr:hypothetical protein [Oceanobacillus salinisoli]